MSQYIPRAIHYRVTNFTGLALCAGTLALIHTELIPDTEQCLFCTLFEVSLLALTMLFLFVWLHNPGTTGQRLYAFLGLLIALPVLAANGQYLWLSSQHAALDCNQLLGAYLVELSQRLPLDLAQASDTVASCQLPLGTVTESLFWLVTTALAVLASISSYQFTRKAKERALFKRLLNCTGGLLCLHTTDIKKPPHGRFFYAMATGFSSSARGWTGV